jgi:hypothetical protein
MTEKEILKLNVWRVISLILFILTLSFGTLFFSMAKNRYVTIPATMFLQILTIGENNTERLNTMEQMLVDNGLWTAGTKGGIK